MSYDSRLRCDFVDLYFTLYGTRRPNCTPTPELAGLLKPKIEKLDMVKPAYDIKPPVSILQGAQRAIFANYRGKKKFTTAFSIAEPVLDGSHSLGGGIKRRAASPLSPREREPTVTTSATDEHNLGIVTVEIEAADEDESKVKIKDIMTDTIADTLTVDDAIKTEMYSDNSASLPGISNNSQPMPLGFEPGMFGKKEFPDSKPGYGGKTNPVPNHEKPKKKKKDKKKHKHKHRHHKHGKEKSKEKKDLGKLNVKEETLSSLSSSPSPTDVKEFVLSP